MKKRLIALFLILASVFGMVAGCKKNVGTTEDNAIKEEEETKKEKEIYRFGFSCITMDNPYFITLEQSLRETIEKEGHILVTKDPKMDVQTQISQIHEMVEEGVQAVFISPVSWEEITPALKELKESGIKIINIDTEVKETEYIDAYIGSDNKKAGYLCGQDLLEQCPDGGKIVILECPYHNSINDRIMGFEEAIAGKGFEVVERANTDGDLNKAREVAASIFADHKDIVAVMCGNDQIALGALVSANTAGLTDVMIYGVDGSPDLKKELVKKESLIRGTSAQSPINMGREAANIGIAMLSGEKYEKATYEEVFFIDSNNVDMYGVDGWQ